jgi:hypothetical protein
VCVWNICAACVKTYVNCMWNIFETYVKHTVCEALNYFATKLRSQQCVCLRAHVSFSARRKIRSYFMHCKSLLEFA